MSDKMSVMEVVDALAAATKWSKRFSRQFLKQLTEVIVAGLERDGEVRVRGLGLFRTRRIEARTGRNPGTGEALFIPAHNKVQFTPEKSLRELVNRRYAHLKPKWLKDQPAAPAPQAAVPADVVPRTRRKALWPVWLLLFLLAMPLLWYLLRSGGFPGAPADNTMPLPAKTVPEAPAARVKAFAETSAEIVAPAASASAPIVAMTATPPVAKTHKVGAGETLWALSADFYREPLFWPLIYYHNRTLIADPDRIEIGQILHLQPLGGSSEHLTGNDSTLLGHSFEAVYQAYRGVGKQRAGSYLQVARQFDPE